MTQCERLLKYLQANDSITPLEAWSKLGIYRCSARVLDLKKDGWDIVSGRVTVKNRFGEEFNVAEYTIRRAEDEAITGQATACETSKKPEVEHQLISGGDPQIIRGGQLGREQDLRGGYTKGCQCLLFEVSGG